MQLTRLLTFRSFRTRPLRVLLSAFGVALGVAAILAIGITNQTALDAVTQVFQNAAGKSNLVILAAGADREGIPESVLSRARRISGIRAAVPLVQIQTILTDEVPSSAIGMNMFGLDAAGLLIYGIDPSLEYQAREYKLVAGRLLEQSGQDDEIVLVDSYAQDKNIQLGNSIQIVSDSGDLNLKVVGLIAKEGAGQFNNGNFGLMPLITAQKAFYRQGKLDQIDLVVDAEASSTDRLEQLRAEVQSALGNNYSVVFPASQGRRMTQMLSNYQIGLNFLSGMALFVGVFLVYNSFSMTILERTREFGMLRMIGMTRAQIVRQVMLEAAILGILSSLFGLVLGLALAIGLSKMMGVVLALDLSQMSLSQSLILTSAGVGIVIAILAALIPAIQAGRISPLEAFRIRSSPHQGWFVRFGGYLGIVLILVSIILLIIDPFPYDVQFRLGSMVVFALFLGVTLLIAPTVGFWERILRPLARLLYGNSGRLGSSNIRRAHLRTTLTVAALMIGVSMITVVWAITGSFKGDLDEWLQGYMGGDLYITSNVPMGQDIWRRLSIAPGVFAASPQRYFEVEWLSPAGEREKITFMAIDPSSYARVTRFTFSETLAGESEALQALDRGDNIFISSVIAEKYGLKPGDSVVLKTRSGDHLFQIQAVVVDYYNQGLLVHGSWLDMSRYFRHEDANVFLVKVQPNLTPQQVAQSIDELYGKRDHLTIRTNQSLLESVSLLMDQAFSMFDVLAIIALIVGFFGISNTLTMNIIERTREIGMLRGMGMTRDQVVAMILSEAAVLGMIGGILGIVLGAVIARIMLVAMTNMSGYRLEFLLPVGRTVLTLTVAILVSQIAAFFPALRAARTRILEAIQYE